MELGYQTWCAQQLTTSEYKIYSILHSCEPGRTTWQELAQIVNCAEKTTHYALKELQEKDFIRFLSSAVIRVGLQILWIRREQSEVAPDLAQLIEPLTAIVQDPEGKTYKVPPKGLEEFATRINLCKNILNSLVNERSRQSRDGWRIIKPFPDIDPIRPRKVETDFDLIRVLKSENQKMVLDRESLKDRLTETENNLIQARSQVESLTAKNHQLFQIVIQLKNQIAQIPNPDREDRESKLEFVRKFEERATILANENKNLHKRIEDLETQKAKLERANESLNKALYKAYEQLDRQPLKLAS